jgi:hypothetical protein
MSKPKKIQIRNSTAEYLQNIFAADELDEKAVCRDFRHTAEIAPYGHVVTRDKSFYGTTLWKK